MNDLAPGLSTAVLQALPQPVIVVDEDRTLIFVNYAAETFFGASLSVLSRQCLGERRFATADALDSAVAAWTDDRNQRRCGTNWRFTTDEARIKLHSLYPQRDT